MGEAAGSSEEQLAGISRALFPLIFVTSAVLLTTQQWHLIPHGMTIACLCFTLPAYFIGDLKRRTAEINRKAFEEKKTDTPKKDGKLVSSLAFMWASFIMLGVWLAAKAVRAVGCSVGGLFLFRAGLQVVTDPKNTDVPYNLGLLSMVLAAMHIVGVLVLLKRYVKM